MRAVSGLIWKRLELVLLMCAGFIGMHVLSTSRSAQTVYLPSHMPSNSTAVYSVPAMKAKSSRHVADKVRLPGTDYSLEQVLSQRAAPSVTDGHKALFNSLAFMTLHGDAYQKQQVKDWWSALARNHTVRCPNMQRVGREMDGGKWMCLTQNPKVVYSLGSNGDFSFESEVVERFKSSVYTFDCTMTPEKLASKPKEIKFFPWCLGGKNETRFINGRGHVQFYTLASIMKLLKHDTVDLLKMDIEGAELEVLRDLLPLPSHQLPKQMLFELHLFPWLQATLMQYGAPIDLSPLFGSSRYKIFNVEPNVLGAHCSEYSVML